MLMAMVKAPLCFRNMVGGFIYSGVLAIYQEGSPAGFSFCQGGSAQRGRDSI